MEKTDKITLAAGTTVMLRSLKINLDFIIIFNVGKKKITIEIEKLKID